MSEIIRERWSPNLYLATIMPRNSEAAEIKAMREQWNAWAAAQPDFRDTFDFAAAIRDPATGGILPAYNADGLHLSSAGSAAQAIAITRPMTTPALPSALVAKPGQVPRWTGTGFRWSWLDQYTDPNTTDSAIIPDAAFSAWAPASPIPGAKGTATEVNTSRTYRTLLSRLGSFTIYGAPRGTVLNGQIVWTSDRIWTTRPGTPA